MADDEQITGFDADAVRAGLHLAMQVGLPTLSEDQPTFFGATLTIATKPVDQDGVPFNPEYTPTRTQALRGVQVPCAVDYKDNAGKLENFGVIVPSKIVLTFLDVDYQQVADFEYVVIQGVRYLRRNTQPPVGLVTVGIWTVHCIAEDDG